MRLIVGGVTSELNLGIQEFKNLFSFAAHDGRQRRRGIYSRGAVYKRSHTYMTHLTETHTHTLRFIIGIIPRSAAL